MNKRSSSARSGLDVTAAQSSLFCEDCGEPPTFWCVDCGAGMCAEVRSHITAPDQLVLCVPCFFERIEHHWQDWLRGLVTDEWAQEPPKALSRRSGIDIAPTTLYTECEHLNTASPQTVSGPGAL